MQLLGGAGQACLGRSGEVLEALLSGQSRGPASDGAVTRGFFTHVLERHH